MDNRKRKGTISLLENLFVVILAFYPLRHIALGIDLQDTGYNYANFVYMGTEHMDPMWLFSTWLADVTGNWLTKLPNAGTLMGMNFYTGLFVSVLAIAGYIFCTRKLKIPFWIVFAGEFAAENLCWCPTALLYNYLSYVLFLGAVILLYAGLTGNKKGCLAAAGVCLGTNVLVRFSNLPQAAMILAVWAYDVIVWLEERKAEREEGSLKKRLLTHTGWCLLGYLAALAALFSQIHLLYGMGEYVKGIGNLFAMTDNATDYKATSMIEGMVKWYLMGMYWAVRIGIIAAAGTVLMTVTETVVGRVGAGKGNVRGNDRRGKSIGSDSTGGSVGRSSGNTGGNIGAAAPIWVAVFRWGVALFWTAVCGAMLVWLYRREVYSFVYYSYDSILYPGILFLILTLLICVIRIFHPGSPKEEKLISGMLVLVILLTSIGSNNGIYPSLNNLFVAAPYTLWQCWRFLKNMKGTSLGLPSFLCRKSEFCRSFRIIVPTFPVRAVLAALLCLCLFQFTCFGVKFVFAEATGVQEFSGSVENNEILKNVKMSSDKAKWMTEISAWVQENALQGREVILYGGIPALSYYLEMPAAFNPWSDLRSYDVVRMSQDMEELQECMDQRGIEGPVVIVENTYACYLEGWQPGAEMEDGLIQSMETDPKWELIVNFMERNGYQQDFRNEKFALYRQVY